MESTSSQVEAIPQIFICYAHKDNESADSSRRWLDRLRMHLEPLNLQEQVQIWCDVELEIGDLWDQGIQETLRSVKAAILLVSPAFLASKYIRNSELPVLLQRSKQDGVVILPIILSPCAFATTRFRYPNADGEISEMLLSDFQAANSLKTPLNELPEHEQDTVLLKVMERLQRLLGCGGVMESFLAQDV
jgi:hypothetical protein